ncbi:MAG TPA: glycosyltransferase family 2 protein [Actinomycetota bacterium]|nr:glycosyltransferase family 2 protein [Actinomycetota bacterium]
MTIRVRPARDPLVSVLMVTYGGGEWPLRSLATLVERTDPVLEVVVIDNASLDGTGELVRQGIEGATVILNDSNRGLSAALNQAAALTSGRHLLLLNPDALVGEGWLPPLLERLEEAGTVAAVPRLLEPDGTVQEAGQIVDRMGQTLPVGAGSDGADPGHRFPRPVEYGTGACLVVRRADFDAVGGMDEDFRPAYCEDVDLGFRLSARGRVVYEPRSTVVHHGGVSASEGERHEMILRNRRVLLEKWGQRLAERPVLRDLEGHPHRPLALRDLGMIERLLVVTDDLPEGPLAELLGTLAEPLDMLVTVACRGGDAERALELAERGVEVVMAPPDGWFEERLFHYSGVLTAGTDARLVAGAARSQPQATRLAIPGLADGAEAVVAFGPASADAPVLRLDLDAGFEDLLALIGRAA